MNSSFDFSFQSPLNSHARNRNSFNIKPSFRNYQLLGDSLFVRFADQILHQPNRIIQGTRTIGHCVSGQRIDQLRRRIKHKLYPLSSRVMVLIGTNDVLCGGNYQTMIKHFYKLFNLLKKTVEKLIILTLPPIPKLSVSYYHWTIIRQYNLFLKSLHDGTSVIVADICPLFTKFQEALNYRIAPYNFKSMVSKSSEKRKIENECNEGNTFIFEESPRKYKKISQFCTFKESLKPDSNWSVNTNTNISTSEISQQIEKLDYGLLKSSRKIKGEVEDDVSPRRNLPQTYKNTDTPKECTPTSLSIRSRKESPDVFQKKGPTSRLFLKCIQDIIQNQRNTPQSDIGKTKELGNESSKKKTQTLKKTGDTVCATTKWIVETDEDSMGDLVYQSQEEVDYDCVEVKTDVNHNVNSDFLKYIESTNESETEQVPIASKTNRGRVDSEIETDTSSDSDDQMTKRQMFPFIDSNFVNFLQSSMKNRKNETRISVFNFEKSFEKNERENLNTFNSNGRRMGSWNKRDSYLPPPTPPPMPGYFIHESLKKNKTFSIDEEIKNMDGFSTKDKQIMSYSNDICYLEYYELFYSFGKKRIDMIHLNQKGLDQVKKYLINNEYL